MTVDLLDGGVARAYNSGKRAEMGIGSQSRLIAFSSEMAGMLGQGMSIHRALALLAEEARPRGWRAVLQEMADQVSLGRPLAEALVEHPSRFPPDVVALVQMGERSGHLPDALRDVARRSRLAATVTQWAWGLALYPIIVISLAMLIVVGIHRFIVPQFADFYDEMRIAIPAGTRFMFSPWAVPGFLALTGIPGAALLLIYGAPRLFGFSATIQDMVVWLRLNLPVAGGALRLMILSRICYVLGMLIEAEVPVPEALELAAQSVTDPAAAAALREAQQGVEEGHSLSGALGSHPLFPAYLAWMISVGTQRGDLGPLLSAAAEKLRDDVRRRVAGLRVVFQILAIILVGGWIGCVVTAMYRPLVNILRAMGMY